MGPFERLIEPSRCTESLSPSVLHAMEKAAEYAYAVADESFSSDWEKQGEYGLRYGAWKKLVLSELRLMAKSHGYEFSDDTRVGSTYVTITTPEDADGYSESLEIRVSDHKQVYSGPAWSIEMQDQDARVWAKDFQQVEKLVNGLAESQKGPFEKQVEALLQERADIRIKRTPGGYVVQSWDAAGNSVSGSGRTLKDVETIRRRALAGKR